MFSDLDEEDAQLLRSHMKKFYEGLIDEKLKGLLESDDEIGLVSLFQKYRVSVEKLSSVANECVEYGASKCLIALVRGKVYPMNPLFDAVKMPQNGVTSLAYIAHNRPDPYIINLMFTNCGATCLANLRCTIGGVDGLPIHFLLINLSVMEHLRPWHRGKSVVKLLTLLCLWETKQILDSLRMLAKYTDSINNVAWTVLKNGGLKQFTALLLIAHEKVLTPFDTGLTIHQYITGEIDSITKGKLSNEQEELICILKDAQTLLSLFEKAGDVLCSYCSSIQKCVPVDEAVNVICALLLKNQVNVSEFDINLSDCYAKYSCSNSMLAMLLHECKSENFTPNAAPPTGIQDSFLESHMKKDYEELLVKLKELLESDDETGLVTLLQDRRADVETISDLVNECVEYGATKCLIALVRGKVYPNPLFDAGKLPECGMTPLAYVAYSCPDPYIFNLMLTNCGASCHANLGCTIGAVHGLPIHFLLINLSIVEHTRLWYRGTSLIKLVILLCLWETKQILDSLQVLVKYTDSINDVAWTFLKHGALRQFAALLLIAREKVLTPFDTGLTIHQYITTEIDSITKGELGDEEEELVFILKDAQTLLTLFEMVGDALSSYRSSIQKDVPVDDVVNGICALFLRNQVGVRESDINFSDCYKKYNWSPSMLEMLQREYKTERFFPTAAAQGWPMDLRPLDKKSMSIPKLFMPMVEKGRPIPKHACGQARLYSTGVCPARKSRVSLPHAGVHPLPRQLGYIAMKFMKRVRYL